MLENEDQVIDDEVPDEVVDDTPTLSPYEEKARQQGWVPKEDWKGDPETWRSAKEFVERGELLETITSLKRSVNATRSEARAIAEHHAKYVERENARIEAALKAQKREALKEGDFDTVMDIDEQLADIKANPPVTVQNSDPRGDVQTDFQAFVSKNPWYNSDPELTEYADTVGGGYAIKNPTKTYEEVYAWVEKQVRKTYPEKFNRDVSQPRVTQTKTTSRSTGDKSPKYTEADLTREQRDMARRFVETGAVKNVQEYVDQLASIGGIG